MLKWFRGLYFVQKINNLPKFDLKILGCPLEVCQVFRLPTELRESCPSPPPELRHPRPPADKQDCRQVQCRQQDHDHH